MFSPEQTTALWHGVVAGFDGTDRSRCAVRWAVGEASVRQCPLHVVRVVEPTAQVVANGLAPPPLAGPNEDRRGLIEDQLVAEIGACRVANPGLDVHGAVHDGPPHARLAEHAELVGANVLAVGSSDLGAVSRLVLGSTVAELIHATSRVVVAVRDLTPVQQAEMAIGYAPVVALVDEQPSSGRVLAFACDMADRWRTSVTVVHAGDATAAALRSQLRTVRRHHPRVQLDLERVDTRPDHTVLDLSVDARLVVVADRRRGIFRRFLPDAAAPMLLHRAKCSVAVIP